jgi:hypothetical protein
MTTYTAGLTGVPNGMGTTNVRSDNGSDASIAMHTVIEVGGTGLAVSAANPFPVNIVSGGGGGGGGAVTQSGAWSVSVSNLPSTQVVSGTFWQATQPVSIASMPSTPVTGTFWQTTQPVSWSGQSVSLTGPLPALSAGAAAIGTVGVTALPALPAGTATIGSTTTPPLTLTTTYYTVTSGGGIALAANSNRRSLEVYNVDTGNVTLQFGTAATAGQGIVLNAASALNSRGDGYFRGCGDGVDQRALYAVAPAGSHIAIVEGV